MDKKEALVIVRRRVKILRESGKPEKLHAAEALEMAADALSLLVEQEESETNPDVIDKELRKAFINLQNARKKDNVSPEEIEALHKKIIYWNDLKKGIK